MGVNFSTIDPKDFSTNRKNNTKNTLIKLKQKAINKQKTDPLLLSEKTLRKKQLKNRLLEVKCGNINCKIILEYVYENKKSPYHAQIKAKWVNFNSTKCWLCPKCTQIQKTRLR
jgi:hypothetical protein